MDDCFAKAKRHEAIRSLRLIIAELEHEPTPELKRRLINLARRRCDELAATDGAVEQSAQKPPANATEGLIVELPP